MKELIQILSKKERLILGVMSGTSLDGVDIALARFRGSGPLVKIEPLAFRSLEFSNHWRKRIQNAFNATTEEICKLNFDLGHFFGSHIKSFCQEIERDVSSIDAIGFHGQTIYHVHNHSTLQIGEADVISRMLQTVVVSDFRSADIAAAGSGAPLVPYLDSVLFQDDAYNIALQNLGGIGNITFLPKSRQSDILAFDTGPANAILNELTEIITDGQHSYDKDAFLSKQGKRHEKLLAELLRHQYYQRPLPKSTGREEFGRDYVLSVIDHHPDVDKLDMLRTFVSLIAGSISLSCKQFLPAVDRLYISGGGASHPLIMEELKEIFGINVIHRWDDIKGITAESKEAIAFALLAHEKLNNVPTNIPSVTGASSKVTLGKLSVPYSDPQT